MDELANFRFAPPELLPLEQELLDRADVVFTGGFSLYEAKKDRHPNVHPFPSSVDRSHFSQGAGGRRGARRPGDRFRARASAIYGVVDERMDLELIAAVADAHPEWSIVMVGPVVKIDPAELPRRANIHYLGGKSYEELPVYLGGWDVALMPFAINDSTRFISPTKTPEYLCGGRPVVSTPITDVIRHYGELDGVFIAGRRAGFHPRLRTGARSRRARSGLAATRSISSSPISAGTSPTPAWPGWSPKQIAPRADTPAIGGRAAKQRYDYLVVGAGFAGSVVAERLASQHGAKVLVVDRRPHIAGNAFDVKDEAGVLIHQYGPHIFHTNQRRDRRLSVAIHRLATL